MIPDWSNLARFNKVRSARLTLLCPLGHPHDYQRRMMEPYSKTFASTQFHPICCFFKERLIFVMGNFTMYKLQRNSKWKQVGKNKVRKAMCTNSYMVVPSLIILQWFPGFELQVDTEPVNSLICQINFC